MKQKKVLVCGGSGFIGFNICFDFSARYSADGVYGTYFHNQTRKANTFFLYADLTKQEDVDRVVRGTDIIIQAAAVTSGMKVIKENPEALIHDNLSMNARIFEAAHRYHVSRVIFLSCSLMYDQAGTTPAKETDLDLNKPMSEAYFGGGWMKVYIEKLCEFYARRGRTRYAVIRHSNVYGPLDKFDPDRSHVTAATIRKVAEAAEGCTVTVWGEGNQKKDLLYISDLVEFIYQTVAYDQKLPFEIVNVGSGQAVSVRDLVELIVRVSGKKLSVVYDPSQPSAYSQLVLDISKAQERGWRPRVSLEQGIQKTYEWYQLAHARKVL